MRYKCPWTACGMIFMQLSFKPNFALNKLEDFHAPPKNGKYEQ